jgi:hypothetical protein
MTPEPPDAPPADADRLKILNWDANIKPIIAYMPSSVENRTDYIRSGPD